MPFFSVPDADIPAIVALVNSAYRGETSRRGWATEADFVGGQRTDAVTLRGDIAAQPAARLLAFRDAPDSELLGCVWLEPADGTKWYLGMLTVRPDLQDRKLGRTLLAAAEDIVREQGATRIRMTVVNLREALIAWYERRGYVLTGETAPFPYGDERFGKPTRDDLVFLVLEKAL